MTTPTPSGSGGRPVVEIIPAQSTIEGGGFEVYRPFPGPQADWFDPFLLLDEMAPTVHQPGQAIGAPDHPHRGFETVTYVLDGEVEHRDSAGNHGLIGPGDAQWMTAGDGIVHSEMPSRRIQTEGGRAHGLQLWVNLPATLRRTTPGYQALAAADLPVTTGEGWTATVLAGSILGIDGPASTNTPIGYARLTIEPGATVRIPVADGHTALFYAFVGRGVVGDEAIGLDTNHLVVFDRTGGEVVLAAPHGAPSALDGLLLTGQPIGEPMARYGPFVMNTAAELEEAVADFNAGRMGAIAATGTL